ncbi:Uncharacterised protein [Chromobacterium violaceum]|uniref:Uncharacterized protein n=1 Tax=Chromobacterium violaceum TaxID=536 RepID=A0A3S4LNW6_CHRVL|nr:Uncharacterised protein [Chromobacterium violaceum]
MVGKPAATVITSSPGLIARSPSLGEVSAVKATRLADEPELTVSTCGRPMNSPSRLSKDALKRPVVNQASSAASTMFATSAAPTTLPDGGTAVWPGMNSAWARRASAY